MAASLLAAGLVAGGGAYAQEKKEEEPFWAKGRPKEGAGAKMAPVAAPPIPTPADKLPKLTAPAGFKVEVYQPGILDARAIRRGDKGTLFVRGTPSGRNTTIPTSPLTGFVESWSKAIV